jgi:hypothetical protein
MQQHWWSHSPAALYRMFGKYAKGRKERPRDNNTKGPVSKLTIFDHGGMTRSEQLNTKCTTANQDVT